MPTETKKTIKKEEIKKILDIRPGYTIKVYQRIREGKKERLQAFEGLVICRKHGSEPGATITVRREAGGFGVERIYPLHSPTIEKVEVLKKGKVRRAKLYYLRRHKGKIRLKEQAEKPIITETLLKGGQKNKNSTLS